MITNSPDSRKTYLYQAPTVYLALFYLSLVAWTVVAVFILGSKEWASWTQFFMVAFILFMTWYFSLGISYRMRIEEDGKIELVSFKKTIRIDSTKIEMVEGPHLPVGFIRFRLEREKAYLFCIVRNRELQQILSVIRKTNPDIKFKNLTLHNRNQIGF
jgi:hypothetical protein